MLRDEQEFSFLCNPAAWMHLGWQSRLRFWGVPDRLTEILWETRCENGILSRFLAERFQLYPMPLFDLPDSLQGFLLMKEEKFSACLIQIGIIFLHPSVLRMIDGADLRRVRQEFGEDDFDFMRHSAQDLIEIKSAEVLPVSKRHALLLGLAAFLKKIPTRTDILTRLWLKLPPFADEPAAPEDFMQIRSKLDQIGVLKSGALDEIFTQAGA